MTAARAIEAGRERLRSIVDDEPRLIGELAEAMDAAFALGYLTKRLGRRWSVQRTAEE